MRILSCGIWFLLHVASTHHAAGLAEHKVHNIVLYPDKHSWCKKTEIKQIVAYPGCSSIEMDNNVCVGACFSYSIPRTIPSAPGEVIIPYCDSCQPVEYEWREVTLTCSDESEEDEGQTEMTKRVQVITNCSCTSCEKQREEKKVTASHQSRHAGIKSSDDVPELMSLMMGVHGRRTEGNDSEEEEEAAEDVNVEQEVAPFDKEATENPIKSDEKENLIGEIEEKNGARIKSGEESRTLEILRLDKKNHANSSRQFFPTQIEITKSDRRHYEFGPHHSLVIKPENVDPIGSREKGKKGRENGSEVGEEEEEEEEEEDPESPPAGNRFKIHDSEEYPDQIAVESIRKEVRREGKVVTLPDVIYNATSKKEKWRSGVRMLEMAHHHLQPAVEGVQFSYYGKSEAKDEKPNGEN